MPQAAPLDRRTQVLKAVTLVAAAATAVAVGAFLWAAGHHPAGGHAVRLDEWHHLYLGLALAGWGAVRRRPWVLVVAALITVDDSWQHVRQVTGDWGYTSPLHHLFAIYLWPRPAVQWLVARLNALVG